MPNDTQTPALLAVLIALRDEAAKRHTDAHAGVTAAQALPKGKRGKREAVTLADAKRTAAAESLAGIKGKIREAMKAKARSVVESCLATLDHRDADPILRQALAARHDKRRQAAIRPDDTAHGVHAHVSLDRFGLPDYIELSRLATPSERQEQVARWIAQAKTPEAKAEAQAFLDHPEAHPLSHFGSSVTLSRGHGEHRNTYGVNGSTFNTHDEEEAVRLRTLHDVAWHLRSALNDADLPKVEELEEILDGNG